MRTRQEIEAEIDKVEKFKFWLDMKDHWSWDDKHLNEEYSKELRHLREELTQCSE